MDIKKKVIQAVNEHLISTMFVLGSTNRDEALKDHFRSIYQCTRGYLASDKEIDKAYRYFLELIDTPISKLVEVR